MPSSDKSIGRVFIEAGVDLSQLNKGFDQIVKTITDVDGKVAAYGKRLASNFEAAYNPTLKLGKQLEALASQGKTAGELIAVFGDRIQKTMETVARTGAEPSKMVANLAAQMKLMNQATEGAGSGFARLGQAMTDFARNPLAATQAGISSILEKMGPLAVGIGGVVAAIGLAAYEFSKFMISISDEVEALENLSAQTGISTQRLQALQQMQREAGLTGMDLGRIIAQLNSQMGKGEGEFVKTIRAMGISLKDSNGEMRDSFDVLSDFGVAIQGIVNPTERAVVATAALGPRAREFVAFLGRMQGSLKDVAEQMEKDGIGFTEEGKKQFDQLDSALDRLDRKLQSMKTSVKEAFGSLLGSVSAFQVFLAAPLPQTQPQMGPPLPPGYFQERIKAQEELDKKQKQSNSEAIAAQKKINDSITASMEYQIKLNDETKVYAALTDAAAKIWQGQIRQGLYGAINDTNELYSVTQKWVDSYEQIYELQPRNPWKEAVEQGQTLDDLMNIQINRTIPEWSGGMTRAAQDVGEVWKRQVSTIVTDWSRGIADILVEGGDFGKKLTDIFKETAKSILRMLIEQLFNPLKNLLMQAANGLLDLLGLGKSGTGAASSIGGLFSGALGSVGLLPGIGMAAGITGGAVLAAKGWDTPGGKGWAETMGGGALIGMSVFGLPGALVGAFIGALAKGIKQWLGKSSEEAGSIEVGRDFGLNISEGLFKGFYQSIGLTESKAYGIRKDLMTSPLFISQIMVPAAQAQGTVDRLLASLSHVTVDTRIAASGYLDFRAAVEEGINTGNWADFNAQWETAFKNSKALMAVMPDLTALLVNGATQAATAANNAATGFQGLMDAISAGLPAVKDMYQVFFETGEILPELAEQIQKYGGNLEVFQRYASLGGLRENLTAIGNLISGLGDILPDLDPIQRLLSGGGIDWNGLQAMGLDPSKLIGMADLVTFETRWEDSVRQFQDTGRLLSGSVLQQALWKFGGPAGATALANWDLGFNTITPGLLSATKAAMDIAYKTERETSLDYLTAIQSTMESEIQAASDAIVAELKNILAAIQNLGTGDTDTIANVTNAQTGESNAGRGPAFSDGLYVTPEGNREPMRSADVFQFRGIPYVVINGDVYGYEDFERKVQTAWTTAHRRGAFGYAVP